MESKYTAQDFLAILLHETVLNSSSHDYSRQIDKATATFILSVPSHKEHCHVQFADRNGVPFKYPVLWSLSGWLSDTESWRLSKLRADKEREASWVFAENHKRVIRALGKELDIYGDCVNAYAYRKLKRVPIDHPFFTEYLKVKLITNVSEIP